MGWETAVGHRGFIHTDTSRLRIGAVDKSEASSISPAGIIFETLSKEQSPTREIDHISFQHVAGSPRISITLHNKTANMQHRLIGAYPLNSSASQDATLRTLYTCAELAFQNGTSFTVSSNDRVSLDEALKHENLRHLKPPLNTRGLAADPLEQMMQGIIVGQLQHDPLAKQTWFPFCDSEGYQIAKDGKRITANESCLFSKPVGISPESLYTIVQERTPIS